MRWFGLVIAGAVSGAMHDLEGGRGVVVASRAHPEPWTAYGDSQLADSPVHRQQAELAVLTAQSQIDAAYMIGQRFHTSEDVATLPTVVYFGFHDACARQRCPCPG